MDHQVGWNRQKRGWGVQNLLNFYFVTDPMLGMLSHLIIKGLLIVLILQF